MNRFSWQWIKSQAIHSHGAMQLVKFAGQIQKEPHLFCGKKGIIKWLHENDAEEYESIITILENRFVSQKRSVQK